MGASPRGLLSDKQPGAPRPCNSNPEDAIGRLRAALFANAHIADLLLDGYSDPFDDDSYRSNLDQLDHAEDYLKDFASFWKAPEECAVLRAVRYDPQVNSELFEHRGYVQIGRNPGGRVTLFDQDDAYIGMFGIRATNEDVVRRVRLALLS